MKIPREVRIGPHSYLIQFNKFIRPDDGNSGNINYRSQIIGIDPALAPSEMDVVFWHEIIHGLNHNFSLGLLEDTTDNLAVGLTQFLFDNFKETLNWEDIE